MSNTGTSVNNIYDERNDFIIIGLTGRTGSGCTTVANILKTKKFDSLSLRTPKSIGYENTDERKYKIIYDYIRENWDGFQVIELSNIIASFIYEKPYDEFLTYLENLNKAENCNILNFDKLKEELSKLQENFSTINAKITEFNIKEKKDRSPIDYTNIINLYMDKIPDTTESLKKNLTNYIIEETKGENLVQSQLYTYLFQNFGNNIRSSGNPYLDEPSGKNIFSIPERTNHLIKMIRKERKEEGTLICIDAIRNPYEATFFKDRYAAFYLFSINTEDNYRRERLNRKLNSFEIQNLDEREYPEKAKIEDHFYRQNIKMCTEQSDIFIYNPTSQDNTKYFLTKQIVIYITLIKHPGLITPTRIERCMQIAYNAKLNSGCLSRQVGAVVTDENYSIKSVGWNDVPEGQVPCNLRDVKMFCKNKDEDSYSNFEITDKEFNDLLSKINGSIMYTELHGRNHPYCFKEIYNAINKDKNQVNTRALHAEENAFLQTAKYGGQGINGGFLFTTASPCVLCSKKAYQLGIKKIYYIHPYPDISQTHILNFGKDKSKNPKMILFHGAIGSAYTSLYTQRISYKDELQCLTNIDYKKLLSIKE